VSETPQPRDGQSEADLADQSLQLLWNRFAGRDSSSDFVKEMASAPIALGAGGSKDAAPVSRAADSASTANVSATSAPTSPTNASTTPVNLDENN
jgi:hypothetical protein